MTATDTAEDASEETSEDTSEDNSEDASEVNSASTPEDASEDPSEEKSAAQDSGRPGRGTALITGASSGIGEAFAHLLATEGFNLVLTARRTERLEALQASLANDTPSIAVKIISMDLGEAEGAQRLCEEIEHLDIEIDLLINNAGMMTRQALMDTDPDDVQQLLTLNITALTQLTHHFLQKMRHRDHGRILNVASIAAFHPLSGADTYAASKAYVLSLSEALSEQLSGTGVSVTALCPGLTATEMVGDLLTIAPSFIVQSSEDVAREGFDALMKREAVRISGQANNLALIWAKHQPRWLMRGLGGALSKFMH